MSAKGPTNKRTMTGSLRASSGVLALAVLVTAAACGQSDESGTPAAAATSTASSADAQSAPVATKGGIERLETGVDLARLALDDEHAGHDHDAGADESDERRAPRREVIGETNSDDGRVAPTPEQRARAVERGALAQAPAVPAGPPGGLSLQEGADSAHHFGSVVQGISTSHTFKLVSDGEAPLVITRVKPSCGCTVAQVNLIGEDGSRTLYDEGNPIPPGTLFEVEAGLNTDGRQGAMKSQVAIYSNDVDSIFTVHLQADVEPVLQLEPKTLHLGSITSADEVGGVMKLSSGLLDPFILSVDEQFNVEPLEVELVALEPDAEGRSRDWEVRANLGPNIPEGMRNYPIRLVTDQEIPNPKNTNLAAGAKARTYQIVAYVQAQVTGLVSAKPGFVSFGMVRPGQVVERLVRIECHDDFELSAGMAATIDGLVKGQEFAYGDHFSVTVQDIEGENAVELLLRCEGMPDGLNGSFGGMVKVNVGHPMKEELAVRFSGVCRQGLPPRPNAGGSK